MALIFLLLEILKSGEPSRYLDHGRGTRKNFLCAFQIKFQLQKMEFGRNFEKSGSNMRFDISAKTPFFGVET